MMNDGLVVNDGLMMDLGMHGVSAPLDDGVESSVLVCGVVNGADGAVGLVKAVGSLDGVSFTLLLLVLDVASMFVFNSILELVVSRGLCYYS